MRVGIGGIWHESNAFVAGLTDEDAFRRSVLVSGERLLTELGPTGTESGGAIRAVQAAGADAVGLLHAAAVPSGPLETATFDRLLGELVERTTAAAPLDAVVLCLHGAMLVVDRDDAEARIVVAVRQAVGRDVPIAVTLDLHANVGDRLAAVADVLVGYRTYPHVDMADRGAEAVALAVRMARGGIRPYVRSVRLPLLTVPVAQGTDDEPMRGLLVARDRVATTAGVWTASLIPGFAYGDDHRLGFTAYVAADARAGADAAALALADAAWAARDAFTFPLVSPERATVQAGEGPGPVVLVDVGDNVGGGSPGDGTELLAALERRDRADAVVVIWDPDAVRALRGASGGTVRVAVGGRHDAGQPVEVVGAARDHGPVRYRRSGPYMAGQPVDMGRVVVVTGRTGQVVLTEHRVVPFDDDHLRVLGIDPECAAILVAKGAAAWKAAFGGYACRAVYARTAGACPGDLRQLKYSHRPAPLHPLDAGAAWRHPDTEVTR